MRHGERRAPFHALALPVGRVDEGLHLDVAGPHRVAHGEQALLQRVVQAVALDRPVDATVEVGHRLQHVERAAVEAVAGLGDQRRLVEAVHRDEDRRVAHARAPLQQVLEGPVPVLAEVDVVVGGPLRQRARDADVPERAAGGVVAVAHGEGLLQAGQQRAVGDGQIGVADHGVGFEQLATAAAVGDVHAAHASAGALGEDDAVDLDAVAQLDPGLLDRPGQADGHGVHAAVGEEHALDGVHVGDDAVDGQRLVRREAGVHRLEAEQLLQAVVVEEGGDLRAELAEPAQAHQVERRPDRVQQVQRRVEVRVDEVRCLHPLEPGEPVGEATELAGCVGADDLPDLPGHPLAAVPHPQLGPVVEGGAVHGVDRAQGDEVVHLGAHRLEAAAQQVWDR